MPNLAVRQFVGYNNRLSPFTIPDNTLTRAFNVVLDNFGNIEKMNGYSIFNSTAIPSASLILGIFRHYEGVGTVAGTSKEMVAKTDVPSLVKFTDAGVVTAITVTGAALDSTRPTWATYRDLLIFTNGGNAVKQYSIGGTATDLGGSPPFSKYVAIHNERVFLAGDPANPSRLRFSFIFQTENYPAANFVEVGKGDGDQITNIAKVAAGLLIWKNHSTWLLQGNTISSFSLTRLSDSIGCTASYSVAEVDGRWYFLSRDGIFSTTGGIPVEESFPIQADIDDIRKAALNDVFGYNHENKWYSMSFQSSASTDTFNRRQVVLDVRLRELNSPGLGQSAWVYHDDQPINCATNWNAGNDVGETYFGESDSGFVRRLDDGRTRAGTNFTYDWRTKFFGDELERIWDLLYIDAEGEEDQVINFDYLTSQPTNSGTNVISATFGGSKWDVFLWDVGTWGGSSTREFKTPFRFNAAGRYVQLGFRGNKTAEIITFRGLNMTYNPLPVYV